MILICAVRSYNNPSQPEIALLHRPRVLKVFLQLVHPDRVVHLPLVGVEATAGRAERDAVRDGSQTDQGEDDQGDGTCRAQDQS